MLSYSETKELIDFVLISPEPEARRALHAKLRKMNRTEPELVTGVIEYGSRLPFSAEQWFDFHRKIPSRLLRDDVVLMNKLSERQRQQLGI